MGLKKKLNDLIYKLKVKVKGWIERNIITIDPTDEVPNDESASDQVDFALMNFCWGHFNGKNALAEPGVLIDDLRVSTNKMEYRWKQGGCEQLGAASASSADCLACLFCKFGNEWKGGKFDWISTSRTTRDFKNVHEGYSGWDPEVFRAAKEFAFVIVSSNGKKRSNIIHTKL